MRCHEPSSRRPACARLTARSSASAADCVGEGDLAVDHDHREVDAVAPLELLVAVDRHPPEPEAEPRRLALEEVQGAGTQPAALPFEEHDLDRPSRRR